VFYCLLRELKNRTKTIHSLITNNISAKDLSVLECSPRLSPIKHRIFTSTFSSYLASDFEMSAHKTDVILDLTSDEDVHSYKESFDIVICAHVLEHIPEYQKALNNLRLMLKPGGIAILQVPLLEKQYTPVTWDEFHGDNTRVFHRFGFDLLNDLNHIFSEAVPVVGMLDFEITSQEIDPQKYDFIDDKKDITEIIGLDLLKYNGLGIPDLCDAFVVRK